MVLPMSEELLPPYPKGKYRAQNQGQEQERGGVYTGAAYVIGVREKCIVNGSRRKIVQYAYFVG